MIPSTSIETPASRGAVMAWASECAEGDYLATFAADETDPTSECGYGAVLLADVASTLRTRNLTLIADDLGLVVASRGDE